MDRWYKLPIIFSGTARLSSSRWWHASEASGWLLGRCLQPVGWAVRSSPPSPARDAWHLHQSHRCSVVDNKIEVRPLKSYGEKRTGCTGVRTSATFLWNSASICLRYSVISLSASSFACLSLADLAVGYGKNSSLHCSLYKWGKHILLLFIYIAIYDFQSSFATIQISYQTKRSNSQP